MSLELALTVAIALIGGIALAVRADGLSFEMPELASFLVLSSLGGGLLLRRTVAPFPFASTLACLAILGVWAFLLALAVSPDRRRLLGTWHRVVGLRGRRPRG